MSWRPEMRPRPLAFTLLETLLTLALVGLVLGLASGLLLEYFRLTQHAASKTAQASAIQVAMNLVTQDARQAVSVVSPPAAPAYPMTDELRFWRVADPDWASPPETWLPVPVPTSSPVPAWNPHDPLRLQEICYHKDDQGLLWRDRGQVGFGTSPTSTNPIAEGLAGFSVTSSGRRILIRMSLQGPRSIRVVTGLVGLPEW